ncbi:DMT family transporter [Alkalinema pantanalense CENA528]|uniref:DMT family transporter n=1 Tax=Alkalinema pantanalense TaxID=1620705 RepID=UPI003D6F232F
MLSKLPQGKSISALLLIAPFFFWGTAMVAMKGAIADTTPFFLAGFRLVPAGFLVLVAAMLSRREQPKTWKAWLWIALFALVDGTLFQGFLAQGLTRTGAGLGSVMIDSQPLAVALLAWILFGEKIGLIGAIGLLLGVGGISLLGLPQEWIRQWVDPTVWSCASFSFVPLDLISSLFDNGQWLMLMAALSMAIGTVMVRYVSRHVDPVVATGWHMVLGGLPLFVLSDWLEVDQWTALTATDWLALGYSTVFGSALSYGLFFYFASQGNLTSLSSLTFLTPVFALTFGNFFLAENLEPYQWLGVALTLVSIYAINQRDALAAKLWPAANDSLDPDRSRVDGDRADGSTMAAIAVGLADDSSPDHKISSP